MGSLAVCGWRAHSLQQDGSLVEQGRCVDGEPALPLLEPNGGGALAMAELVILEATRLHMRMIEKDFHEPAEDGSDLRDPNVEPGPRGVILRRLIEPRPIRFRRCACPSPPQTHANAGATDRVRGGTRGGTLWPAGYFHPI